MIRGGAGHALLAPVAVRVLLALVRDVHAPFSVPARVDASLVLLTVLALLALRGFADPLESLWPVHAPFRLLAVALRRTDLQESRQRQKNVPNGIKWIVIIRLSMVALFVLNVCVLIVALNVKIMPSGIKLHNLKHTIYMTVLS